MSASLPAPGTAERAGAWSARTLFGLINAEVRKAFSTAAWWALLLSAALIAGLYTLADAETGGLAGPGPEFAQATALSSLASKFAVVFGVIVASAEFRHRTATTSYLTAPGRPQLLLAKVAIGAAMGAAYAVVCAVASLLGSLLGGATMRASSLTSIVEVSSAAVGVFALWGVLGVGIGTLISNQLGAVVAVLVYLLPGEILIGALAAISDIGRIDDYLPGGAADAVLSRLAGRSLLDGLFLGAASPWWVALLVFAGWTAVAVLAGAAVAQRRDIT